MAFIKFAGVWFTGVAMIGAELLGAAIDPGELGYVESQTLTRGAYIQRVLENNGVIQARLASFGSTLHLHRAEGALFEPELVGSTQRIDRRRPNTIEIERSLQSGGTFVERNWVYSAGVEVRTPTGGRVVVGGSARELRNNVQRTVIVDLDAEYEASFDLTVEQPLLRGAGIGMTLAPREMAARNAEIGYQEFRRQLMLTVAQAEVAYWELSLAQEQYWLSNESVRTASTLLDDGRKRFEAGRGTQLDVIEAQAGVAMRESRRSQARQRLVEAMNRFAAYFNGRPHVDGILYQASESPSVEAPAMSYELGTQAALEMSPELLRGRRQIAQEELRVRVARNQRLPQVDLRASFSSAGLGFDWDTAMKDVEKARFPQWVVGVDVRIPILKGMRTRNELLAAQQRLRQAEYNQADLEASVRTEMDASIRRVQAAASVVASHRQAVDARESLLEDRMRSREAGRVDARMVLEAEDELVVSRLQLRDSEVEFERSLLELQMLQGTLLQYRGLDMPLNDLERKARNWLAEGSPTLDFLHYQDPAFAIDAAPLEVDARLEDAGWWELVWPFGAAHKKDGE